MWPKADVPHRAQNTAVNHIIPHTLSRCQRYSLEHEICIYMWLKIGLFIISLSKVGSSKVKVSCCLGESFSLFKSEHSCFNSLLMGSLGLELSATDSVQLVFKTKELSIFLLLYERYLKDLLLKIVLEDITQNFWVISDLKLNH